MKAVIHAKQRLEERYGMKLNKHGFKALRSTGILRLTASRSLHKVDGEDIYFVYSKSQHKIITFYTKEMCVAKGWINEAGI